MPYSRHEKIILKMLKDRPRLHHNAMQKQSGIPKKTFEKHLKSLVDRGKITSYEYDGKKCYVIRSKSGLVFSSLPPAERLEWKIAWKLQETQEFFEAMKKSFDSDINQSDREFARQVFENIISNMVSIIIHDSLLSWKATPHNKFIKAYRKLIKEFFEVITPKSAKKIKSISSPNDSSAKKKLIRGKKIQIKSSTHDEEPFAKEIAKLYSETKTIINPQIQEIIDGKIGFSLYDLILDDNKIKHFKK